MNWKNKKSIRIRETVSRALDENQPVVALESTVIAHGLPYPLNIETARACESAVRNEGATAATIAIVDGVATIGLSEDEVMVFANSKATGGKRIDKVGLNN